jgi:hypothetical protein
MMLTFKLADYFSMRFDRLISEYYFGFILYCYRLVGSHAMFLLCCR